MRRWRGSRKDEGGNCVEVAACPGTVHIRDSKGKAGPQLAVAPAAWGAFVGYAAGAGRPLS
ncbi:DUF397 domain-containing protein [Actinacidiphila oryziradicis]|uniref:DUF397 domain-containing protein n=1 Tax=Actinacidiphila oryziradicis TaxID=2571141 RepID=A0A4U0SUA7_9ACTN|nr:DUF397 domain-containing protein [Actinacidiphila oryziradicis]TKA13138.1 DUF397 domain-containing protein [Actinacidiphila oryziradicis]